ncbi:protein trichome birefringence-like 34 isoform X1 [Olea europaea var. sylvestris]|uniref:protein trichome birefringence-like 34 isoform X1 n=1 Tax=Olea europaea var. sylvestris TaxID=158386 RepID=UPI000C1D4241|nr:protein trichome birefringence-like 34 isoform X1 [Olea europaea var. sylvestris]
MRFEQMTSTHKLVLGSWKIRHNFHFIAFVLLIAFVIAAIYLTRDSRRFLVQQTTPNDSTPSCDLFSGKWVYDNVSYPLYEEKQCSFMEDAFTCEKCGRKDLKYQKWRWQPHDCDLPRLNATALLEKLRGKKLVFVGDSLNRNQFNSMLCLIEPSIPPSTSKSLIWKGNSIIFEATDYNATIEFHWSPLLVESNCDDLVNHRVQTRIIRVKAIEKHARQWTDADILIFDSFMWWLKPKMTLLWGSFGSPDAIYKEVGMRHRRFEMALNTWADWMEFHINRNRTKLFFMSSSPFHFVGEDWGMDTSRNCYNETEPIFDEGYWGSTTDRGMMQIVESAIYELETRGLKVDYLNITQLSDYRKDAHPSIHRRYYVPLTEEQLAKPESRSDCVHWCLPGVPDIWNVILYSYIMRS